MINDILLTIGVTILLIGMILGLIVLLKIEIRKYRDDKMLLSDQVISYDVFKALIERVIKRNTKKNLPFTIIQIDIDKFQDIEDTFNKDEEAYIMSYVASHIKSALPEESIISSSSKPDEFYIYIPHTYDHSNIYSLAKNIKKEAEKKIQILDKITIKKTISMAIASFPLHGNSLDLINQSLEIAMYMVKKSGGNDIKYYSDELNQTKENMQLYQELKIAKENKEFIYYYQPIVHSKELTDVYGFEALLRWNHPKRGLLMPGQFLHLAEQTGELDDIGIIAVEQALELLTDLSQLQQRNDLIININLSPRQVLNEMTFTIFQRMVDKYNQDASSIAIEIPDFSLYKKNEVFRRNLIRIKTLGFKIAMDIQTTDYDMLDLIERFQIDMIKFNRKFFMLEDNYNFRKYYQMIVEFAENKKLKLVAEGIENKEMLKSITEKGVPYAQGFFISNPLSPEELFTYLGKIKKS
ncbi:Cyclic di-GMP phosphodiesterase Gmr [Acholeplasma oculi]|uniref:Diguanylate cyclase/Phosphodiesterase n=1 Tax=Acholeplasma oculi TaxID=35623 RepID=A0A061A9H2_9MOLU|nr:GGDEF domain-containing phosphodiesterase [Acholeplasma oculi]CDR30545.1 Diguanylate cyclase/Phosphodiesterase [Acholeplasma oculi]SKC47272.1 diguanylate cyclase (GGDEF) domain-containing protein [Acholeplasma oculi]SUT89218.1 Cyclic di-GMP phosphodiesterase Gmr [Acholeplasma oculi]